MNNINFDNPYLLLLAIPLAVLFLLPFLFAIRKDNRNGHNVASMILHIVLAVVVAFSAAGTKITRVLTETQVFVVADVSYSANKNLDTIDTYIQNIELPLNAKLGVVAFGKDYELLCGLGKQENALSVKNAKVDDSETNIVEALQYAGTLFDEDVIKRIVLITDGKQSDERNRYALQQTVDALALQNIKVDAIFLDDNLKSGKKEMQVSSVNFTSCVYLNQEQKAEVQIQSSYAAGCLMAVYKDGKKMGEDRTVEISEGSNILSLDLFTDSPGQFDYKVSLVKEELSEEIPDWDESVSYEARILVEEDESEFNNSIGFTQKVSDQFKVLIVSGAWGDSTALADEYVSGAEVDVFDYDSEVSYRVKDRYIETMEAAYPGKTRFFTTKGSANVDLPTAVEDLMQYDEIVLSNINIGTLPNYLSFINSVDALVATFGKSLVTMGNLFLQNSDAENEELTRLGNMLPVRFTNDGSDPKLYTLVIDGSRSMVNLSHMVVAKQVACRLLDILNPEDSICVVTFFGDARILISPTTVGAEEARESLKETINNIELIQGTLIGAGLHQAYELLRPLPFSDKQVMLITDGLTFGEEEYDAREVADVMYEEGIVTSVFDVGRLGDRNGANAQPEMQAAQDYLKEIAERGHGKYVYSANVLSLSDVTFGEIADVVTEVIVNREATVTINRSTDEVLNGIEGEIPNVSGYINCATKASATTVLTVNHRRANSERTVSKPLYAYWDYGNGRVSSLTSAMSASWLEHWKDEGISSVFLKNMFRTNLPEEKTESPLSVTVTREGKFTRIDMAPPALYLSANATLEVELPSGEREEIPMNFNANGYFSEIETSLAGKYVFGIDYVYGRNEYRTEETLTISYLAEHNEFEIFESSSLHRAIDGRGTVSEDGRLKIENDDKEIGRYTMDLTIPLLITAIVLFLADIIVRKLKWEDVRSFLGLNKKEAKKK